MPLLSASSRDSKERPPTRYTDAIVRASGEGSFASTFPTTREPMNFIARLGAVLTAGTICATAASVTFNEQIAPIVYTKCAGCHRAGESAPFSLTSYQDVAK